jgi:hypothetical protein
VGGNQNLRSMEGTTEDLVRAHTSPNGKILNALDFPLPFAQHPPASIGSNYVAWKCTNAMPGILNEFPASSSKWGLAATAGAYHGFHIDCDGFATYIDCISGSKWWVIARPVEKTNFIKFTKIIDLLEYVRTEGEEGGNYILEAVLLTPGTRL